MALRSYPQRIRHDGRIVAVKRAPVLRKPKGFKTLYPGHLVALDTIEEHVLGLRRYVLTDNGSEFKKYFNEALFKLHVTHYHAYPKTPKMNAHLERFNRTLQEEFLNFHKDQLRNPDVFNGNLMDYLVWYNTRRVHYAFNNQLSPLQFLNSLTPTN